MVENPRREELGKSSAEGRTHTDHATTIKLQNMYFAKETYKTTEVQWGREYIA